MAISTPLQSPLELFRVIKRRGLDGWFRAHPAWRPDEPECEWNTLTLTVRHPEHCLRLRVEPTDLARGASVRGQNVQVVILDTGGASAIADELAKRIVRADARGLSLAFTPPAWLAPGRAVPPSSPGSRGIDTERLIQVSKGPPLAQVEARKTHGWHFPLLLRLENNCLNRCFFCTSPGTSAIPKREYTTLAQVDAWLDEAEPLPREPVGISSNEPLAHPDIRTIAERLYARGWTRQMLLTSGNTLGDRALVTWLVQHGVTHFSVPLYSHRAKVHDAITGATCFRSIVRGLDYLAKLPGVEIAIHAIAMKQNLDDLPGLADFVHERYGVRLAVIPLNPKRNGFVYEKSALSYESLVAQTSGTSLCLGGFPLCITERVAGDRATARRWANLEGPPFSPMLRGYRTATMPAHYAPVCTLCPERPACPGTLSAYAGHFGEAELAPCGPA
jgi:hypothetical protein